MNAASSRSPPSCTCTPRRARPRARRRSHQRALLLSSPSLFPSPVSLSLFPPSVLPRREQPEHLSDRRHRDSPGPTRPCVPCLLPAKFAAAVLFLPDGRFASASRTSQARPALTLCIDRAK
ncbi:hypothetical protein VPH35_085302 [Triticum aestivum]